MTRRRMVIVGFLALLAVPACSVEQTQSALPSAPAPSPPDPGGSALPTSLVPCGLITDDEASEILGQSVAGESHLSWVPLRHMAACVFSERSSSPSLADITVRQRATTTSNAEQLVGYLVDAYAGLEASTVTLPSGDQATEIVDCASSDSCWRVLAVSQEPFFFLVRVPESPNAADMARQLATAATNDLGN